MLILNEAVGGSIGSPWSAELVAWSWELDALAAELFDAAAVVCTMRDEDAAWED